MNAASRTAAVVSTHHVLFTGCINECDGDIRRDLWQGLCLAGGTSLLRGLPRRLKHELSDELKASSPSSRLKLAVAPAKTRQIQAWIGGSIVACTQDSAEGVWMTKQEYDDVDPALVRRMCF